MAMEIYQRLARHMDTLPGGFPSTDSGVEIRILRHLFSEAQATLALHLTLLYETPEIVAHRSGLPLHVVAPGLAEMAEQGLILRSKNNQGLPTYMALQYIVGIWELQVNRLTVELVEDMDIYLPTLLNETLWKAIPQMRTIPIKESITPELSVMTYEDAESLIRSQNHFVLSDCICRKEQNLIGKGCDKPLGVCMSFGTEEDFMLRTGAGKKVDLEEALQVLRVANKAGLVIQPSFSRNLSWMCFCCGCCCAVLRSLNQLSNPGEIASSPFIATTSRDLCIGCGRCVKRCPMQALSLEKKTIRLDPKRCIGCGLCASVCKPDAIRLIRKGPHRQHRIPNSFSSAALQLGHKRGVITTGGLLRLAAESMMDRIRVKMTEARSTD